MAQQLPEQLYFRQPLIRKMKFHLNYNPQVSYQKISHKEALLMLGSCFSEHIGRRLSDLKFNLHSNPFGIMFNPESMRMMLDRMMEKRQFKDEDVFEKDGQWFCFEAHSSISANTKAGLLNTLNAIIGEWSRKLKTADFLSITFGSAFAYERKDNKQIVANCHKLPQALFNKVLIEPQYLIASYKTLLEKLKQFNPSLNILFTVSPVKHLRDGVEENSLSKAILLQAVHGLVKTFDHCFYFPAYELVTDDLRDYRFYKEDMAHPNEQAIDYVWQKFINVYFNEETCLLCEQLEQISQAMKHRFFHENSETTMNFKKKFHDKCLLFQSHYPFVDLSAELDYFKP
jgi:hypothetical protein